MDDSQNQKLRGRELTNRLVGVSIPEIGVDWHPTVEERNRARQLLAHLAKQQVLWDPYDIAIGSFVTRSILDIREILTSGLRDHSTQAVLKEGLHVMLAACGKFLDMNQSPRSGYGTPYEAQLHSTLGELRALFGLHIARIACVYDLEVEKNLEGILPSKIDWN
jgi:hypothetical protein